MHSILSFYCFVTALLCKWWCLGAVRRNKRLKGVTKAEIDTVVKLWLRYARDRSGDRQARHEQTQTRQRHENTFYSDVESDW